MTTATLEPVTNSPAPRLVNLAEVQAAARALGNEDHLSLLNRLVRSLPKHELDEMPDDNSTESPPLSPAWIAEIERRSREIDEGTAKLIPYEEIKKELHHILQG